MRYPVNLTPCDGGYVVSFPDIPEALTQGDDREEALSMAADALVTAFDFYFEDRREVPLPSLCDGDFIEIPASVTAKVLLLNAVVQAGVSNAELARMVGTRPQEITRVFDLHHATKIDTIQKALSVMGKRLDMVVS